VTDFDPTQYSEEPAVVDPAGEAPAKFCPKEWYRKNRDVVLAKRRAAYSENKNGIRDRALAAKASDRKRHRVVDKEKARQRYLKERDMRTSKRLKKDFGITLAEYDAMFELQKGLCAICNQPQTIVDRHGNLRRFSVDHDHKTGKVRQLLCGPCNMSIGLVKENVKVLNTMIDYIKKHGEPKVKTVSIELTLDELQAVAGLIDAGIKSVGLTGVKSAAAILVKLEAAVAAVNAAEQKESE